MSKLATLQKQSESQRLNAVAKQKLEQGGLDAVKHALKRVLVGLIDGRGGGEWDNHANADDKIDCELFVALEILAEWIDYESSEETAKWRQQRLEKFGD